MKLSQKEISILRTARSAANQAWDKKDKWAYGEVVSTIVDLGYSVLWLFVSDEVFNERIKEYSDAE